MRKVIYIFLEDLTDVTDCDDRNTNDVGQIIRNKLGLVYKDESVDKKTAFYDCLSSKIYRNLFRQTKQSQGYCSDRVAAPLVEESENYVTCNHNC